MIRLAEQLDLSAIDYIYNQAIYAGFCTADLHPIGEGQRKEWFQRHDSKRYPVYVFEEDENVLGWASLSPYREGCEALQEVAELSYYVDFKHHGRDIGTRLVQHCLEQAHGLNKRVLFAIIIDGNEASIGLLEKFGFEEWGFLPDVIKYEGELRGQYYLGKVLNKSG